MIFRRGDWVIFTRRRRLFRGGFFPILVVFIVVFRGVFFVLFLFGFRSSGARFIVFAIGFTGTLLTLLSFGLIVVVFIT